MSTTPYNLATHNGRITVRNRVTGNHRTFGVRTQPHDASFAPDQRIVALLTGSDNREDYTPFGFVLEDGSIRLFRSKSTGVWTIYADIISNPTHWIPKGAEYFFEGRCRKCNRLLTTPDSIESGVGPVCDGRTRVRNPARKARYRKVHPQLIPTCP